ncbi:MAG TPA: hypothetical protein PLJ21_00940 [Pseudobdellovibrionaceae bacterium]|nr:hypothetical protein [Pseudobdellovibrionaceae bacterium]
MANRKQLSISLLKLTILAGFIFASACDKKDEGRPATTPLNNTCLNQACDTSVYNQQGWQPYPTSYSQYGGYNSYYNQYYYGTYSYNYYGQFCDCPSGYLPVYNSSNGLGCVQNVYVQPYWNIAFYASLNSNNNWTNVPIMSSVQSPANASSKNCYNGVLNSCIVDQPNSCGYGYGCQVTAGGSRIGICVRN